MILDRERVSEARDLMERVLHDGRDIADTYPLVFGADHAGHVLALAEDDGVRTACGILARDFLLEGGLRVRGGLIGSVATDAAWRDQGLATRLLVEAEAALQDEGCAFALLWAEDPDFYARRGYGPIGAELDFLVPATVAGALPAPREGAAIRPARAADSAAIHELYERHPVRVARTAAETAALLDCPGMTTLVLEHAGELAAYACLGRGSDLPGAIHEWSGATEDVLALTRAHLEAYLGTTAADNDAADTAGDAPGGVFLMAPPQSVELAQRLTDLGAAAQEGILGLGKILDRSAACELLSARLGDAGSVALVDDDEGRVFALRGPEKEGRLDDEGALALLFSVPQVRADVAHPARGPGPRGRRPAPRALRLGAGLDLTIPGVSASR